MPRRLKVNTHEMGVLELYLIYEVNGEWEEEWRPLQGAPIADLITVVTKEVMDDCLKGLSKPLFKALGLPPWGCLRKVPEEGRICAKKEGCVFYDKQKCFPTAKKISICFQPNISTDEGTLSRAADLISLWREGVYVVLVKESV